MIEDVLNALLTLCTKRWSMGRRCGGSAESAVFIFRRNSLAYDCGGMPSEEGLQGVFKFLQAFSRRDGKNNGYRRIYMLEM
jgi:hypothetical protein